MRSVCRPAASASSRMRSRRTVFPTPRRPTMITLFVGRPRLTRSVAISTVSPRSSRRASSWGGVPAPGVKGLDRRSTIRFIASLGDLQRRDTPISRYHWRRNSGGVSGGSAARRPLHRLRRSTVWPGSTSAGSSRDDESPLAPDALGTAGSRTEPVATELQVPLPYLPRGPEKENAYGNVR